MSTTLFAPPNEIVHLSGIRWQTYTALREELVDRHLRLTYNRGSLEIMTPSPEHELRKEVLRRFVETLAEEFAVQIYPLGSATFQYPELSGVEPDKCFYIRNIPAVRGKRRLDLAEDPPPDLVLEIDITRSSNNRLEIYAELGVAEVWVYNGAAIVINQLQKDMTQTPTYTTAQTSQFFPNVSMAEIREFLQKADTMDYLELVKEFRAWVKTQ